MADTSSCPRCDGPLIDSRCPRCDREIEARFVHREVIGLILLCVVVVVGFVLTRAAAAANRRLRLRDAAVWYEAGQHDLAAGRIEASIKALRRASAIDRDERRYRLALAAALGADRQDDAARQVLLGIRTSTPEDPSVNVQLARLEARHDDLTGAVRYYQSAVYGLWDVDQADARRHVRIELIRYLLTHEQRGRALSELLVLSGNVPDDAASQTEAGQLFLQAGEPRRGLDHFRRALRADATNRAALAGAGEAAFELRDYASAQRYLHALPEPSERLAETRTITDLVLTRDPLRPRLPLRERQKILALNVASALQALDTCIAGKGEGAQALHDRIAPLRAEVETLEPQMTVARLRQSPEVIDAAVSLICRLEQRRRDACGPGTPLDRALLLVGERHEGDQP
jgi:hypothetical protein